VIGVVPCCMYLSMYALLLYGKKLQLMHAYLNAFALNTPVNPSLLSLYPSFTVYYYSYNTTTRLYSPTLEPGHWHSQDLYIDHRSIGETEPSVITQNQSYTVILRRAGVYR